MRDAHKAQYLRDVRGPLESLGAELADEFGTARLFRPYRDVRFSKDKTPYKDHQGMFVERGDGLGWYVQLSADGLMVAGGWYSSSPDQVARYRRAVAQELHADQVAQLTEAVTKSGLTVGGVAGGDLGRGASRPITLSWSGWRYRNAECRTAAELAAWMGSRRAATTIRDQWRLLDPLLDRLAGTVGAGETAEGTGSQNGL